MNEAKMFGRLCGLLIIGYLVSSMLIPVVFPEIREYGKQGWVVNAQGAVFGVGAYSWYMRYHAMFGQYARLHRKRFEMAVSIIPLLGFYGTVVGMIAFLPTWGRGQPDIDQLGYAFLTTAGGLILTSVLMLADGLSHDDSAMQDWRTQ